eukprot:6030675-Prymnesium_polylepis.1
MVTPRRQHPQFLAAHDSLHRQRDLDVWKVGQPHQHNIALLDRRVALLYARDDRLERRHTTLTLACTRDGSVKDVELLVVLLLLQLFAQQQQPEPLHVQHAPQRVCAVRLLAQHPPGRRRLVDSRQLGHLIQVDRFRGGHSPAVRQHVHGRYALQLHLDRHPSRERPRLADGPVAR